PRGDPRRDLRPVPGTLPRGQGRRRRHHDPVPHHRGAGEHPHDTYEVVVDDGECRISEEPGDEYDASLMMAPPERRKIVTGRGNPTMLVRRGKIKVRGDVAAAAQFPSMFDIPKARSVMNPLTIAKTMAKRGMLNPGPPANQVKQLTALKKWGFGLAGELRQAANRSPRSVAVIDESRGATTYAELLANSERIAVVLGDLGFGPGDRIGLLARNH